MRKIEYKLIDDNIEKLIVDHFGEYIVKHKVLHREEGCYSIAAMDGDNPVGFISTRPNNHPEPMIELRDAYIDVIEVDKDYRRMGIARELITRTERWAEEFGYEQIRAWSNNSKVEAIPMWQNLGFCLCPAKIWVEWCEEIVDGFYVAKKLKAV